MFEENITANAIKTIVKELKRDPAYYISWQANIAMAFQDEMHWAGYKLPDLHAIANRAADNFLKLLMAPIPESDISIKEVNLCITK